MSDKPVVLGGDHLFMHKVHIVQPRLPAFNDMAEGIQGILASGMVTKGQHLRAFEEAVAEHLGVKHAVAVSSCTTGLMLTYRGLGLTGEVIVPSFTFMATVSAMIWAGLHPIFADVDLGSTNLDPAAAEASVTPATSAIVAVHNFGNPANMEVLQTIADLYELKLVFDAAHGFGALHQGIPVGSQGNAHVFSLSPTKLLIAGEGGIVATNDDSLAKSVRNGREYGNCGNYDSAFAGLNARMAEFNALMGLYSLAMLEDGAHRRNEVAAMYRAELGCLPGIGFQEIHPCDRSSYKDFSITVDPDTFGLSRTELALALAVENVDTRSYYEPPIHRQTAYQQYAPTNGLLPNTELLSARSLSLPIYSHMDDDTMLRICRAVERIHQHAPAVAIALEKQKTVQ